MSETKDGIAAERDALRAENENLRGQLAAAGARPRGQVRHEFLLSEGERAEIEAFGVANIGGVRMTREQVAAKLGDRQRDVELGDAEPVDAAAHAARTTRTAVEGVDFIYPSVEPGLIDPAVAGTPGINDPAADQA
jgi:hypothetical protein